MNRKGTFLSMCLLAVLFGSGFLSSCDQNKNEVEKEIEKEKNNPDNPTPPTPDDNIYSFVEQKRFLENTGIELLNMFPKDNFTGLVDFGGGVFDKYEIGRAAWSIREMDFGLVDEHMAPVIDELVKYL